MYEDGLLTGMSSLKIWLILYGSFLVLVDTLFFTYFPTTLVGVVFLSSLLWKFKLPLALKEDVDGFFGSTFRPLLQPNDNLESPPAQEPEYLTVRSRLLLMQSPPKLTSTPNTGSNGQNGGSHGVATISEAPLIIIGELSGWTVSRKYDKPDVCCA